MFTQKKVIGQNYPFYVLPHPLSGSQGSQNNFIPQTFVIFALYLSAAFCLKIKPLMLTFDILQ